MAIKKSDLRSFDEEEAALIEKKIDERLLLPRGDGMLTFSTMGWSSGLKREVQRRYVDAGWVVDFVDDQRDGAFMVLK